MEKQAQNTIGMIIKSKRKALKIKQKDLAEAIGKSLRTVQGYENGTINISLEVLNKIADVLDCSSYDFLDDESKRAVSDLVEGEGWMEELIEPLGVKRVYVGKKSQILLRAFESLNDEGKNEAIKRTEELSEIEKYKKSVDSDQVTNEDLLKQEMQNLDTWF